MLKAEEVKYGQVGYDEFHALEKLAPGKKYVYDHDPKGIGEGKLTWLDTGTAPTNAEIKAKVEELQAAEPLRFLRLERDVKLEETDWWGSADRTMTDAQKKYRQDLRDMPANTSDPNKPTWPTKPS